MAVQVTDPQGRRNPAVTSTRAPTGDGRPRFRAAKSGGISKRRATFTAMQSPAVSLSVAAYKRQMTVILCRSEMQAEPAHHELSGTRSTLAGIARTQHKLT